MQVAAASSLNGFGHRRRIATLAAQMTELSVTITDAAIAMFDRLTGQILSRSRNRQDQDRSTGKARAGKLIQPVGETIDTMHRAVEPEQDPFAALDAEIAWHRLLKRRVEIAGSGELAASDPLSLASERYACMRRFAPAFLEAFEFNALEAGEELQAAIALLREQDRSGRRKLPDGPPMPFPARHWRALTIEDGRPRRRVCETAVIATLRDRRRAGDVRVEGSRDHRRLDSCLMPRDKAEPALKEAGFETGCNAWIGERRRLLTVRLDHVDPALKQGRLPGDPDRARPSRDHAV